MAVTGTAASTAPAAPPAGASPWARAVRLVLVLGWVALFVCIVVTGERAAELDDLEQAVADGEVGQVRITGDVLPPGVRGSSTVEVHWHDGWLGRVTTVVEAHRDRGGGGGDIPVVRGDVGAELRAIDPGLEISRQGFDHGSESDIWGWDGPGWVALVAALLVVATVGLLVLGPQPWRATRWAWFWLLWAIAPLSTLAFVVLSGPVRRSAVPPRPEKRLTGGVAFVLMLVLGALSSAVLSAIW